VIDLQAALFTVVDDDDEVMSVGEAMSLNCGHQRAYCSTPMCYMSTENQDRMISAGYN